MAGLLRKGSQIGEPVDDMRDAGTNASVSSPRLETLEMLGGIEEFDHSSDSTRKNNRKRKSECNKVSN